MFVETRNPAWSTCYSRWPPVPASPCYRKRSPSASLPLGFASLRSKQARPRSAPRYLPIPMRTASRHAPS